MGANEVLTGLGDANKAVKRALADSIPTNPTGFNPAGAGQPGELIAINNTLPRASPCNIMAMVTTAGDFYSVPMYQNVYGDGKWYCGGCRRVPPIDNGALNTLLRAA